ncbi:DUF934 domain-containing protein [Candidatus Raskinella chloraquaticus]|uniref:Oxidoreductase n=1 Tax=Candidatus Raskinella chloraquaticus TaxID=1951219 RepID=A0A1W9HW91_9HYPH|nr:MAG: hypothetical protein A4S15_10815 [Proteobacteria bacterium SG_bin8]
MPLYRNGQFVSDDWSFADDNEILGAGPSVVSKARFLQDRDGLLARNAPLGLVLQAGENFTDIEEDLLHFAMIVLTLPKFTDGRAYSLAYLLRDRYDFSGEIRARGDVLRDQVSFLLRAGFDSLEVSNEPTIRALAAGDVKGVSVRYQPAADDTGDTSPEGARPWLRLAR